MSDASSIASDASSDVSSDASSDVSSDVSSDASSDVSSDASTDARAVDGSGSTDAGGDDVVALDVSTRPDSADTDAGRFPCPRGYTDCDGDPSNGCEVALSDDATNCGACGAVCVAGHRCSAGVCVPDEPLDVGLAINHGCAVLRDRSVGCWGSNAEGELGDGSTDTHYATVRVVGLREVRSLALADSATCALRLNGTVACWGSNTGERLGQATVARVATATDVAGITGVQQVSVGTSHACAVQAGGRVTCWGQSMYGEAGSGSTRLRELAPSGVLQVAAGTQVTCVLRETGVVQCIGRNISGAFGATTPASSMSFVSVPGVTSATAVVISQQTVCATLSSGRVLCWGLGNDSGTADPSGIIAPAPVLGVFNATGLVGNMGSFCVLSNGTTPYCWGGQVRDILGDPTYPSGYAVALPGVTGSVRLATTTGSLMVRRRDEALVYYGTNISRGGGGSNVASRMPLFGHPYDLRCLGGDCGSLDLHGLPGGTCALREDGRLACWGTVPFYSDGDARPPPNRFAPALVAGLTDVVQVAHGADHVCVRHRDGRVLCWGSNAAGQLGDGLEIPHVRPAPVLGVRDAVDLASGAQHVCVVRADETVGCWGDNNYGELGDGSTTDRGTVGPVTGLTDAIDVGVGADFSCALRRAGTVVCWGLTARTGVGGSTPSSTPTPTAVPGVSDVVAIDSGRNGTCARRRNGTVVCWGATTLLGGRPTEVTGITDAVEARVGEHTACVVRASGEVRCWGYNADGELGNGATSDTYATTPTPVLGLTDATHVSPAGSYTCARRRNGQVVCWGRGALGDGTNIHDVLVTRAGAPLFGLP